MIEIYKKELENKLKNVDFNTKLVHFHNINREELLEINICNLLYAIKGLWIDGFRKLGIETSDNAFLDNKIDDLFHYSKNPVKKLSLMTVGAHKPIDLFYYK